MANKRLEGYLRRLSETGNSREDGHAMIKRKHKCHCDHPGCEAVRCGNARLEPIMHGGRVRVVIVHCECKCHESAWKGKS